MDAVGAQPKAPANKSRADRVAERSNPNNRTYQRRIERQENRGIELARQKEIRNSQAQQKAAPKVEQKPMKTDFEKKREQAAARPIPHEPQRLSVPEPRHAPKVPEPSPAKTHSVPQVPPSKSLAMTPTERQQVAKQMPPPPVRRDFTQARSDTPATPQPARPQPAPQQVVSAKKDWGSVGTPTQAAPAPQKDWGAVGTPSQAPSMKKDWSDKAFEEERRKLKPTQSRDRDR